MRITQEEARRRLGSASNLARTHFAPVVSHEAKGKTGPKDGSHNAPPFLREIIGDLARAGTQSQQEIAVEFGVSQKTVSDYKTGACGTKPATLDRRAEINERQEKIKDVALTKLMTSLGLLSNDKIDKLDARGISTVATNMAKVVNSLNEHEHQGAQVSITVYAPSMKTEDKYKSVDV